MSQEIGPITCDVICDLLVVYASGEASEETVQLVETHLKDCPECQEALDAYKRGEDTLSELPPAERAFHIDARRILIRIQRLFFGGITLILLLVAFGIALVERWFVQGLFGIQLSQLYTLDGNANQTVWAAIGIILPVLFLLLYYWRTARTDDDTFLSLIGSLLLLFIGLIAYKFMLQAGLPGVVIAGGIVHSRIMGAG